MELVDTAGALGSSESSNNGANNVSNSLRVSDNGSVEDSGKFRRLVAGPKLWCSEAIQLSSGFVLKYTKAIPVESVKKERRQNREQGSPSITGFRMLEA